jgi:hypothetical protein
VHSPTYFFRPEDYNLNVVVSVNIPATHEGEDTIVEYGPDFVRLRIFMVLLANDAKVCRIRFPALHFRFIISPYPTT